MQIERYSAGPHTHRRLPTAAKLCGLGAFAFCTFAAAQYDYDPSAADEQGPAIRYFGSAKDDKGSLLQDVTIELDGNQSAFVFVTDDQGRFRGNLPLGMGSEKVTAKC